MNRYGRQAQQHWRRWRPRELGQIPDPEAFFTRLGREVETQVDTLAAELAGEDPPGEDYLGKVGRLSMARFTAEGQVLRELVLLPPEPGHPDAEPDPADREQGGRPGTTGWLPTSMTAGDPGYHDLDDDPLLRRASGSPPTR